MNLLNSFARSVSLLFLLMSNIVFAQNSNSLNRAKDLNSEKKYKESLKILESWNQTHQDLNSLWLYAETLHLGKKYKKSQKVYQRLIKKFPNEKILQLDFANKLAESGQLDKAITKLKPFTHNKNEYQNAGLEFLAKVYFWQGAYDDALRTINKVLKAEPKNKKASKLKQQIVRARSHWVAVHFTYLTDNQPRTTMRPEIEAGYYINDFATIGANFKQTSYQADTLDYSGSRYQLFNNLNFRKMKLKSHLELGFNKLPNGESAINALVLLKKNLYKYVNLEVHASSEPYLLTNIALEKTIQELQYGVALTWENPNGFTARTGYDSNQFPSENNQYYTGSIWALSPKLKASFLELRLGYGFSYSDSQTSTFTAKDSLNTIIDNNWDNDQLQIEGFYNPFFSPSKQMIHSGILSLNKKPNDKFSINFTGSYGFYSLNDNPYLKLKTNEDDEYYIERLFTQERYYPMGINSSIAYTISSHFAFNANYQYQSTKYYDNQLANLILKYTF